jgi:imidazolonepropionase-like amidohydrolase
VRIAARGSRIAAVCLAATALGFQDAPAEDVLAIVNVRIITVTKGDVASGTIVIKGGQIAEIGESVRAPTGATVLDGKGLVAFPGLVHPYTRIGSRRGSGFGDGAGASNPHVLAYDDFTPASDVLTQLPRSGFTTIAIYPSAGTVSGQAVALKPFGASRDEMVVARSAYLRLDMDASTAAKDQLRRDYEAGKKAFEAQKKTPPPPDKKPDERLDPWIRHLKGEMSAIVDISSAAEFAHFRQVVKAYDDLKAPTAYVLPAEAYKAADKIGELKPRVIVSPDLTFLPFTRTRVNVAAELSQAGAEVALAPTNDSLAAFDGFLFRVTEMVKYGLDRGAALRAVTIVPAQILGLDKRVGSLEAGKDADIILFDGDPLSATARIQRVLINGKIAWEPSR